MRRPLRLESGGRGRRGRRDDRRIAALVLALAVASYGGWVWLEYQSPGLPAWLEELRRALRGAGPRSMVFATGAILLLVALGLRGAARRAPPRHR